MELESLQTTPAHRRYLFSRGEESTRVDFVRDRGPQLLGKTVRDGVAMEGGVDTLHVRPTALDALTDVVARFDVRQQIVELTIT